MANSYALHVVSKRGASKKPLLQRCVVDLFILCGIERVCLGVEVSLEHDTQKRHT